MVEPAQNPTLCLCVIVKNESHIIRRCLESVRAHLSHWIVVDTGSSDDTREIVRECLAELPGRLYEMPWRDFAHNRNEALGFARKLLADDGRPDGHVLVIDADEVLEGDSSLPMPILTEDVYYVRHRLVSHQTSFLLGSIVRASVTAHYHGVLHEVLRWAPEARTAVLGGFVIRCFFDSARNSNPQAKYEEDAKLLEQALLDEPNDSRTTFYLAQSYRDSGQYEKSIATYRRRLGLGGSQEEIWYSLYQIGALHQQVGQEGDALLAYVHAYSRRPSRAEPLIALAAMFRAKQWWPAALAFATAARTMPRPEDGLFLDESAYSWRPLDEYAIACSHLGQHDESNRACESLLSHPELPNPERGRVENNLRLSKQACDSSKQSSLAMESAMDFPTFRYDPSLLENQALLEQETYESSYQALAMIARMVTQNTHLEPAEKMALLRLLPDDHPGVLDARAVCGYYCKDQHLHLFAIGVESLRRLLDEPSYRGYVYEHRARLQRNAEFYGTPWVSMADAPEIIQMEVDEIHAQLDHGLLTNEERDRLQARRALLAPRNTLRHRNTHYPEKIIEELCKRHPSQNRGGIAFTITTCRRLSLFQESMNAFLNCCLDRNKIDTWFLVDDNSPEDERAEMRRLYPFFHFIERGPDERGHERGLNALWQRLDERDTEYVFHMEDDRVFLRPKELVKLGLDILADAKDQGVIQVIYSRMFADSWNDWHFQRGNLVSRLDSRLRYVLHQGSQGDRENDSNSENWPHFSLNPSLLHFGRMRRAEAFVPRFVEGHESFELEFARRFAAAGFRTAFPDDIFVLHTGKLYWEQHTLKKDAYQLNRHNRFGRKY